MYSEHTIPEGSCSYSPPPIVATRDVAERVKKKKIPIFFLNRKAFDIMPFTTNLIRKHCFGNSVWADRTKRCIDHINWPSGYYLLPLLYRNSGDQSSAGKKHPLPQSSLVIRVTSSKAVLDQWTLLVQLDLNSLKETIWLGWPVTLHTALFLVIGQPREGYSILV